MTEFNQLRVSSSFSCSSFEMLSETSEDPMDNAEQRDQLASTSSNMAMDGAAGTQKATELGEAEDHLGFAQPEALLSDHATLECMTGVDELPDAKMASQLGDGNSKNEKQLQRERPSRTADLRKPTPSPQTTSKASCAEPRSRLPALALGALTVWMILMSVILTAGAAKSYHNQRKHAGSLAQITELVDARLANLTLPGSSRPQCPGPSIAEYMQEQAVILQNIQAAIGNLSLRLHQTAAGTASEVQLLEQLRETLAAVLEEHAAQFTKPDSVKDLPTPSTTAATAKGSLKHRGLEVKSLQASRGQNVVAASVHNLGPNAPKHMQFQQPHDIHESAATNKARNRVLVSVLARYRNKLRAMSKGNHTTTSEEEAPAAAANITTRHSNKQHLPVIAGQKRDEMNPVASKPLSSAINAAVSKFKGLQAASHTIWPAITQAASTASQHMSNVADKAVQNTIATTAMLHSKVKEAKSTTRKQLLPLHVAAQQWLGGLQAKAARARQWVCKEHTVVDSK